MKAAAARGCAFVNVSPLRDDLPVEAGAEWLAPVPGTDTAMMLGMAHTLLAEGLHDAAFIARVLLRLGRVRGLSDRARRWRGQDRRLGRRDLRAAGGDHRGPRAAHGGQAVADRARPFAAARRAWRTADLDGRRTGGDARADRPAGWWLRLRAGGDRALRQAAQCGAVRRAAAGQERGAGLHPGRAHRRHAAESRPALRLQRPADGISRHPAGLLGRRQSVPSPPGPEPPAPRLRRGRDAGGARDRLDRHRAPRRHRAADDDDAGTRGYRRRADRPADGGDAPGRRALRPGAGRLRHLRRPRRTPGQARCLHRGPRCARLAAAPVCRHPAGAGGEGPAGAVLR